MRRTAVGLVSLAALAGCDVLFPEDTRLGVETPEQCLARVASATRDAALAQAGSDNSLGVPTYTYDVTKLDLEAIQALSRSSADEMTGTRLDQRTNETATAVDAFMAQPVDENGAFFMGHDPALYRVRGKALPLGKIIAAGCARQQANMRLIKVEFIRVANDHEARSSSNENENDR